MVVLPRTGSNHAPLVITMKKGSQQIVKPFEFLDFCFENKSMIEVVRQNQKTEEVGNCFWLFKHKVKNVKKARSRWSRDRFGNIFQLLTIREEIVSIKEELFEEQPSQEY